MALATITLGAAVVTATPTTTPVEFPLDAAPGSLVEEVAARLEPTTDGWTTEVLSSAANSRLKAIVKLLLEPDAITPDALAAFAVEGVEVESLVPAELVEIPTSSPFTVRRGSPGEGSGKSTGLDALALALRAIADAHGPGGPDRIFAKTVRIELAGDTFTTKAAFEASGRAEGRTLQQTATWKARWTSPTGDEPPRLLALGSVAYEDVELVHPTRTLFSDVTASAFGDEPAFRDQVVPPLGDWLLRLGRVAGMSFVGHHGMAVGDVDGDGLEDLYVTDAAGLPNRLWIQNPDGTVRDASERSGANWLERSRSALLVDLDRDDDPDLVVATGRRLLISENDGSGRFTLRLSVPEVTTEPTSLAAADPDEDGDLDLYVCGYRGDLDDTSNPPAPLPYHDARNGGSNVLLENRGGFRFVDSTATWGLDENNHGFSFAAIWEDVDVDGDLDLYVANDFGRNNLYRNEGGRFRDVAARAEVEDTATGMGVTTGDIDRDGYPEIHVSNMYSSAGGRIAYQRRFADGAAKDSTLDDIRRMARGNTLFSNDGDGTFTDVSLDAGVAKGLWAWGSRFADLDNDTWPDLVVTNGFVTNPDTHDL